MNEPNIPAPSPRDLFIFPGGKTCTRAAWDAGAKRYLRANYRVVLVGSPEYLGMIAQQDAKLSNQIIGTTC